MQASQQLDQPVPFKVFETLGSDGRIHRNFVTEQNYQYSQTQSKTTPKAKGHKTKNSDIHNVIEQSQDKKAQQQKKMVSRNFHLQKPEKDQRASKSKTQYNSRLTEESRVPQQKNITLQQPTNHNNSQQPKSEFLSHRFSAIENNRMHSAMDTSKQSR